MSKRLANCAYCGKRRKKTKDHVPPLRFFPSKRPKQLWTVPCCPKCNTMHAENDEEVWAVISCLDQNEKHPIISSELQPKAIRLMSRNPKLLGTVAGDLQIAEVFSKGGIYLGDRPAFDLDKPCMNVFMDRMTRGLVWRFNRQCGVKCRIDWRLLEAPKESFESIVRSVGNPQCRGQLGDGYFSYLGWYHPNHALHFIQFYSGEVFFTTLDTNPGETLVLTKQ